MTPDPDWAGHRLAVVPPNGVLGILGGGQLGRMLAAAAQRLGIRSHAFTPEPDSPTSAIAARTFLASYSDDHALEAFARSVDVITYEFENISAQAVERLQALGACVFPGLRALATAQDRLIEKEFVRSIGARTAPFHAVDSLQDLEAGIAALGRPSVLKTRRFGYDGKGQTIIGMHENDLSAAWDSAIRKAWDEIGALPAILEAFIDFEMEISVVAARGRNGEIRHYDPPRNVHSGGILRRSRAPSGADHKTIDAACDITRRMLEALDYVGVIGVEFFVLKTGDLLVNEFAPRVHNSGHWTLDACMASQFEQHVRAVCGWPLAATERHSDAIMDNLIGKEALAWRELAEEPGVALHLYGKREVLEGRKMGHVTRLSARSDQGR